MKNFVGFGLVVAVLLVAHFAFSHAADLEDDLATANEQLITTGQVTPAIDQRLDDAAGLVARVPVLGPRVAREVRLGRAVAAYWQGDYAALTAPAAAQPAGTSTDDDPALLMLKADATFRNAVRQNRTPQTLLRGLDEVLKGYAEVLKADPEAKDAAYNYEYVVRLRAALAANRGAAVPNPRQNNMQGEEGEPPEGARKSEFNVIVPLRPEERQEQLDPGGGAEFKRKG